MTPLETFGRLVVALLVGLLIGLDRERAEVRKGRRLFGGIRTFPLIAVAGAIATLAVPFAGPALVVVGFVFVAGLVLVSYLRSSAAGEVGLTTEMAALVTFLLGVLAGSGELLVAAATGIITASLLVAKPRLEGFSRALTEEEVAATLELAVISLIVLPLLPNRGYGPWEAINPFALWLVVVLVSGLSFFGFVAVRVFGERRGLLLTAALGALVSSTAVTMAMAQRARGSAVLARVSAGGAVLASAIMCLRVAVLVAAFAPTALVLLGPVLAAMVTVAALAVLLLVRSEAPAVGVATPLTNPFRLSTALTFGAVYGVVVVAVRAAEHLVGPAGILPVAALSGLIDVDAIAIAVLRRGPEATSWRLAIAAVTIAMIANTLVKLGMAVTMGPAGFRLAVGLSLGMMALAGAGAGAASFFGW